MYIPLTDAPCGTPLVFVKAKDIDLAVRLRRMGLFEGKELLRLDEEVLVQPIKVKGPKGEFILGGGMAARVIVHLDDGRKIPLLEMKPDDSGHVEGSTCGWILLEALNTFGFEIDEEIRFVRKIPPMEYVTLVEKTGRVRLNEGIAAKIWGRIHHRHIQFASARVKEDFEVLKILGGQNSRQTLASQGIRPGKILLLEGVEQADKLNMAEGIKNPLVISTRDGLRLFLRQREGKQIFVQDSVS